MNNYSFIFVILYLYRFPDDSDLHLIMKNQMMPIFKYFKHEAHESIDQTVSILVETYFDVSYFKETFKENNRLSK